MTSRDMTSDQEVLVQLLEQYRPYVLNAEEKEIHHEFLAFALGAPSPFARGEQRHVTASAVVINRDRDKILLIFSKKYQQWHQPGGHLEPGETPYFGAKRELFEETGIDAAACFPTIFDIDMHEAIHTEASDRRFIHMDVRFLCTADEKIPLRESEEIAVARWQPLENVGDELLGSSRVRLARKIQALSSVLGQ